MAKQGAGGHSAATRQVVDVRMRNGQNMAKVEFGSVTISGAKPSASSVAMNVERSTEALERVARKLVKPGVALRAKKGVPYYSVAEGETGVFVRRLDGRVERGRLVDGAFKVID